MAVGKLLGNSNKPGRDHRTMKSPAQESPPERLVSTPASIAVLRFAVSIQGRRPVDPPTARGLKLKVMIFNVPPGT